MSPKAQFIGYTNLFILHLFLLLYFFRGFIIFSFMIGDPVVLFLLLLMLVFIIWGTVNAFIYLSRKPLNSEERLLSGLPLINLTLLTVGVIATIIRIST